MTIRHQTQLKLALLLIFLLTLTLPLVTCSNNGNKTTTGPTPTPTSTPTPTPTPTPTLVGTTYTGDGFTLTNPQGWTAASSAASVQFTSNTDPLTSFTINFEPADSGQSLDGYLNQYLAFLKGLSQNATQDNTVPTTTLVGGDIWKQAGITGTANGQLSKTVVLVDQHPANTGKIFIIFLNAKADSYNQISTTIFQPMLGSFKFTS